MSRDKLECLEINLHSPMINPKNFCFDQWKSCYGEMGKGIVKNVMQFPYK
jgi:hypothetical protein